MTMTLKPSHKMTSLLLLKKRFKMFSQDASAEPSDLTQNDLERLPEPKTKILCAEPKEHNRASRT